MIDAASENLVTLTRACRLLPPRRNGARPNLATLYRWTNEGIRGVRLEFLMIGGTRTTSKEALQRFFERLTELEESGRPTISAPSPKLTAARKKQIEAAERRLAAAGI
jgi:hypothetical protein